MGIPKYIEGIQVADIPTMAAHADAESNPLYPVPVLMDVNQLQHMYYVVGGLMAENDTFAQAGAQAGAAADAEKPEDPEPESEDVA